MTDLICFSHLRWDFVYQRPQHLLTRFSKFYRVFYWEEPVFGFEDDHYQIRKIANADVWVVVPHLRSGMEQEEIISQQRVLLDNMMQENDFEGFIAWYYSPMSLLFSDHLRPLVTIYDCMDELSAFKFAPVMLKQQELLLLSKADIVFTGGHNLYQSKKNQHTNIHPFPSSIDKEHFYTARSSANVPEDQKKIPHPQIGFYGVIDERINIELISQLATTRPDWQIILIGPIVKIDPATLPQADNIHYLGGKSYHELPAYLGGWDIAFMPFALNESTEFISPTKTPEFLAGGRRVISTSITDVMHTYGEKGLVHIADTCDEFIAAAEYLLENKHDLKWLGEVDVYLSGISWDKTFTSMNKLIDRCMTTITI